MTEIQQNNPLHGLKLDVLLNELVDFYGWETMGATMKINCFINKPSMEASLKFLRKTTWAREKVEAFYLYRFKNLPRPDDKQYALPPRDRTIPLDQQPRSPVVITPNATPQPQLQPKFKSKPRQQINLQSKAKKTPIAEEQLAFDPWAEAREKFE